MTSKQLRSMYQLKVSLVESKPPIWRRLLVHSNISLSKFHDAIQYSMGWTDSHLHLFDKDGISYGVSDEEMGGDFGMDVADEKKYTLSDLLLQEKDSLTYEYDFGDSWAHKVVLEKILPFEESTKRVRCIKGKRACPPEDCGGIWGYKNLLEIIDDPSHPERDEMLEWLGGSIDPEYFSLSETNRVLSRNVK